MKYKFVIYVVLGYIFLTLISSFFIKNVVHTKEKEHLLTLMQQDLGVKEYYEKHKNIINKSFNEWLPDAAEWHFNHKNSSPYFHNGKLLIPSTNLSFWYSFLEWFEIANKIILLFTFFVILSYFLYVFYLRAKYFVKHRNESLKFSFYVILAISALFCIFLFDKAFFFQVRQDYVLLKVIQADEGVKQYYQQNQAEISKPFDVWIYDVFYWHKENKDKSHYFENGVLKHDIIDVLFPYEIENKLIIKLLNIRRHFSTDDILWVILFLGIYWLVWLINNFFRAWIYQIFERLETLVAIVIFGILFYYLESRNFFLYFLSDDNLAQFMPYMVHSCRILFEMKEIPSYAHFNGGGTYLFQFGIYASLYPIVWLSWAIAKYLFKNEVYLIEIYTCIHFLIGIVSVIRFLKYHRVDSFISVFFTIAWIFSGYHLMTTRSWYYTSSVIAYLPLSLYLVQKIINENKWKHAFYLCIVFLLFYFSGNVQLLAYSALFLGIFVISQTFSAKSLSFYPKLFFAVFAFLVLCSPFVLLQISNVYEAYGARHDDGELSSIAHGILSIFFPYPYFFSNHPMGWPYVNRELIYEHCIPNEISNFYFINPIVVAGLLFLIPSSSMFFSTRKVSTTHVLSWSLIGMGILAFVLCLGSYGFLWNLLQKLPFFDKFFGAFKFFPFFILFLTLYSALENNRVFAGKKYWLFVVSMYVVLSIWFAFFVICHSNSSFYPYYAKSILDLEKKSVYDEIRKSGSYVWSITPERSAEKNYVFTLPHNISTLLKIHSLNGYENFSSKPVYQTVEELREHAVGWIILPQGDIVSFNRFKEFDGGRLIHESKLFFEDNDIKVFQLNNSLPIFRYSDGQKVEVRYRGFGYEINSQNRTAELIANIAVRDKLKIYNEQRELVQYTAKDMYTIIINLQNPCQKVYIDYSPFFKTCIHTII
ncbi:MAG: hypothetical protein NZM38_05740 [Cytophagales bacterium]|nr:hypothetical protein [Cytophagales bacterium]MDW8384257.1 hypothetical protein [Flammeovirgaceae bacterium]